MGAVREGLLRLSDATAAARARGWARRWHTRVLLAAAALAWVSAALLPLPGLDALRGRWLPSFAAAAGLVLLGLVLRLVARPWLSTRPSRLAARLDDERGWKDAASTALEVEQGSVASPLGAYLVDHAAALVGSVPSAITAPVRSRGRPWLRIALVVLFLAALLLPGVDGSLGLPGAGREGPLGAGSREEPSAGPMDADEWLRQHGTLGLASDPFPPRDKPLALQAHLLFGLPLPAAYAGELFLLWDGQPRGRVGQCSMPAGWGGKPALDPVDPFEGWKFFPFNLLEVPDLKPHLTPGKHRVRVRLVPTQPPFTMALLSNEIEVEVPEGAGGGGGGAQPPPEPPPQPPPPEPPPTPEPTPQGSDEPQKPPPGGREEAVKPLVNEGETVKKDSAVVEVKDPNAGTKPPPAVPLADALRDFDRLVERAVGSERIPPADRDYLRRYFRALQRLVAPEGTPPK